MKKLNHTQKDVMSNNDSRILKIEYKGEFYTLDFSGNEREFKELISSILKINPISIKGIKDCYDNYYTITSALENKSLTDSFSPFYSLVVSEKSIEPSEKSVEDIINSSLQSLTYLKNNYFINSSTAKKIKNLLKNPNNEIILSIINLLKNFDMRNTADQTNLLCQKLIEFTDAIQKDPTPKNNVNINTAINTIKTSNNKYNNNYMYDVISTISSFTPNKNQINQINNCSPKGNKKKNNFGTEKNSGHNKTSCFLNFAIANESNFEIKSPKKKNCLQHNKPKEHYEEVIKKLYEWLKEEEEYKIVKRLFKYENMSLYQIFDNFNLDSRKNIDRNVIKIRNLIKKYKYKGSPQKKSLDFNLIDTNVNPLNSIINIKRKNPNENIQSLQNKKQNEHSKTHTISINKNIDIEIDIKKNLKVDDAQKENDYQIVKESIKNEEEENIIDLSKNSSPEGELKIMNSIHTNNSKNSNVRRQNSKSSFCSLYEDTKNLDNEKKGTVIEVKKIESEIEFIDNRVSLINEKKDLASTESLPKIYPKYNNIDAIRFKLPKTKSTKKCMDINYTKMKNEFINKVSFIGLVNQDIATFDKLLILENKDAKKLYDEFIKSKVIPKKEQILEIIDEFKYTGGFNAHEVRCDIFSKMNKNDEKIYEILVESNAFLAGDLLTLKEKINNKTDRQINAILKNYKNDCDKDKLISSLKDYIKTEYGNNFFASCFKKTKTGNTGSNRHVKINMGSDKPNVKSKFSTQTNLINVNFKKGAQGNNKMNKPLSIEQKKFCKTPKNCNEFLFGNKKIKLPKFQNTNTPNNKNSPMSKGKINFGSFANEMMQRYYTSNENSPVEDESQSFESSDSDNLLGRSKNIVKYKKLFVGINNLAKEKVLNENYKKILIYKINKEQNIEIIKSCFDLFNITKDKNDLVETLVNICELSSINSKSNSSKSIKQDENEIDNEKYIKYNCILRSIIECSKFSSFKTELLYTYLKNKNKELIDIIEKYIKSNDMQTASDSLEVLIKNQSY